MSPGWLKERLVHGAIYCVVILAIGLGLYKLFIEKTSKTVYTAPSYHALEGARYAPFSCAKIILPKDK